MKDVLSKKYFRFINLAIMVIEVWTRRRIYLNDITIELIQREDLRDNENLRHLRFQIRIRCTFTAQDIFFQRAEIHVPLLEKGVVGEVLKKEAFLKEAMVKLGCISSVIIGKTCLYIRFAENSGAPLGYECYITDNVLADEKDRIWRFGINANSKEIMV